MRPRRPHEKPRPVQFTRDGHAKMEKELQELQLKRKDAVHNLAVARSMGDLSENAAYTAARRKLSAIDSQIRRMTHVLRHAEIVERTFNGFVELGCSVIVDDGNATRTFTIVGGYESDIMSGKISQFSPIGKALMGKKKGDKVYVHAPAGIAVYSIVDIEAA